MILREQTLDYDVTGMIALFFRFPFASQAAQLRAYQKDHLFVQTISQELRDIFALFPQGQALQRNEDFLTFLSQSIYFFTTVMCQALLGRSLFFRLELD